MASSLASIMVRSDDAQLRVPRALGSAALSSRAKLSRKVRRCSSSTRGTPLLQGAVDVLAGGAGALADGLQGLPEGGLVEGVGTGGLGGELDHPLVASLVGLAERRVGAVQDAGRLAAMLAGAAQDV